MNSRGSPLPAEEWTLCLLATWLADDLKAASIKVYLSAVRALHIEQGFPDPLSGCLGLQRVLKGIKRYQGSSSDKRLPVTPAILRAIYSHLDLSQYDDVMFSAACCLAYFGFSRSSEFTIPNGATFSQALHLSVHDIAADQRVAPFRQGCILTLGQGRSPLCPVEAMLNFMELRGGSAGPLFVRSNGVPLTRTYLSERLRRLLSDAGIPGNFSSHSFRIGAATSAALAGIPDHLIQKR